MARESARLGYPGRMSGGKKPIVKKGTPRRQLLFPLGRCNCRRAGNQRNSRGVLRDPVLSPTVVGATGCHRSAIPSVASGTMSRTRETDLIATCHSRQHPRGSRSEILGSRYAPTHAIPTFPTALASTSSPAGWASGEEDCDRNTIRLSSPSHSYWRDRHTPYHTVTTLGSNKFYGMSFGLSTSVQERGSKCDPASNSTGYGCEAVARSLTSPCTRRPASPPAGERAHSANRVRVGMLLITVVLLGCRICKSELPDRPANRGRRDGCVERSPNRRGSRGRSERSGSCNRPRG
jgi:hypothetical protein